MPEEMTVGLDLCRSHSVVQSFEAMGSTVWRALLRQSVPLQFCLAHTRGSDRIRAQGSDLSHQILIP